jgi:glycosyltransferase involved in cell wall biosynthesis
VADRPDLAPPRRRVAYVTDIPTPYGLALLRALARRVDLTALFSARKGHRGMAWDLGEIDVPHEFVGGLTAARRDGSNIDVHLSPAVFAALRRARPEAVICAGFSAPTLYALAYARLSGAALLIYSDGTAFSERNHGRLQRWSRRLLMPRAQAFIAKSRSAADRFVELGGAGRVVLAPHTAELAPFLAAERPRPGSESGPLALLSVGRLIARKGVDRVLRALALTPGSAERVALTIVGEGPEEPALRALAAKLGLSNVRFAGFVQPRDLPAVMARADVFVLPTSQDPFAVAALEAAAAGLALLTSTAAGATRELTQDGVTGFAFDPADVAGLAARVDALAADRVGVRAMGEAARARARERAPERVVESYRRAIEFALRGEGAPDA